MDIVTLAIPILYFLFVLGLCTHLLVRGVTHSFVAFFAGGALLQMIPRLGFLAMREAPGGFSANTRYIPFLTVFGVLGTICFAAGFFTLAMFLLAPPKANL